MDNAMARAYALRALSQRFPEGTEMTAADRALLGDLAREHVRALTSQLNDLHRTLAPVLVSLGGSSSAQGRPANSHAAWQPTAEDVFQSSRRVEVLLSTLLGVTPETPNAHVPTDLLAAFADAKAALENLRGYFVKPEPEKLIARAFDNHGPTASPVNDVPGPRPHLRLRISLRRLRRQFDVNRSRRLPGFASGIA